MDLQGTVIDKEIARVKFLEYRDEVRRSRNEEDARIMRGYREVMRGRQVISLTSTLHAGGRDAKGLPRLAVARADAKKCWLEQCTYGGFVIFTTQRTRDGRTSNNKRDVRQFAAGTLPVLTPPEEQQPGNTVIAYPSRNAWGRTHSAHEPRYMAIVPSVPPSLRPGPALGNYDILWEVGAWKLDPTPPTDPALLKHIGGDLYAVMAVWDLTDLERLVIQDRADV